MEFKKFAVSAVASSLLLSSGALSTLSAVNVDIDLSGVAGVFDSNNGKPVVFNGGKGGENTNRVVGSGASTMPMDGKGTAWDSSSRSIIIQSDETNVSDASMPIKAQFQPSDNASTLKLGGFSYFSSPMSSTMIPATATDATETSASTYLTLIGKGITNDSFALTLGDRGRAVTIYQGGNLTIQNFTSVSNNGTLSLLGSSFKATTGASTTTSGATSLKIVGVDLQNTAGSNIVIESSKVTSNDKGSVSTLTLSQGKSLINSGTITLAGSGGGIVADSITSEGARGTIIVAGAKVSGGTTNISIKSATGSGALRINNQNISIVGRENGASGATLTLGSVDITNTEINVDTLTPDGSGGRSLVFSSSASLDRSSSINVNGSGSLTINTNTSSMQSFSSAGTITIAGASTMLNASADAKSLTNTGSINFTKGGGLSSLSMDSLTLNGAGSINVNGASTFSAVANASSKLIFSGGQSLNIGISDASTVTTGQLTLQVSGGTTISNGSNVNILGQSKSARSSISTLDKSLINEGTINLTNGSIISPTITVSADNKSGSIVSLGGSNLISYSSGSGNAGVPVELKIEGQVINVNNGTSLTVQAFNTENMANSGGKITLGSTNKATVFNVRNGATLRFSTSGTNASGAGEINLVAGSINNSGTLDLTDFYTNKDIAATLTITNPTVASISGSGIIKLDATGTGTGKVAIQGKSDSDSAVLNLGGLNVTGRTLSIVANTQTGSGGSLSLGSVNLLASGAATSLTLSSSDKGGNITVGNIVARSVTEDDTTGRTVSVTINNAKDNTTTRLGNVTLSAGMAGMAEDVNAALIINTGNDAAKSGNLMVGDITLRGGTSSSTKSAYVAMAGTNGRDALNIKGNLETRNINLVAGNAEGSNFDAGARVNLKVTGESTIGDITLTSGKGMASSISGAAVFTLSTAGGRIGNINVRTPDVSDATSSIVRISNSGGSTLNVGNVNIALNSVTSSVKIQTADSSILNVGNVVIANASGSASIEATGTGAAKITIGKGGITSVAGSLNVVGDVNFNASSLNILGGGTLTLSQSEAFATTLNNAGKLILNHVELHVGASSIGNVEVKSTDFDSNNSIIDANLSNLDASRIKVLQSGGGTSDKAAGLTINNTGSITLNDFKVGTGGHILATTTSGASISLKGDKGINLNLSGDQTLMSNYTLSIGAGARSNVNITGGKLGVDGGTLNLTGGKVNLDRSGIEVSSGTLNLGGQLSITKAGDLNIGAVNILGDAASVSISTSPSGSATNPTLTVDPTFVRATGSGASSLSLESKSVILSASSAATDIKNNILNIRANAITATQGIKVGVGGNLRLSNTSGGEIGLKILNSGSATLTQGRFNFKDTDSKLTLVANSAVIAQGTGTKVNIATAGIMSVTNSKLGSYDGGELTIDSGIGSISNNIWLADGGVLKISNVSSNAYSVNTLNTTLRGSNRTSTIEVVTPPASTSVVGSQPSPAPMPTTFTFIKANINGGSVNVRGNLKLGSRSDYGLVFTATDTRSGEDSNGRPTTASVPATIGSIIVANDRNVLIAEGAPSGAPVGIEVKDARKLRTGSYTLLQAGNIYVGRDGASAMASSKAGNASNENIRVIVMDTVTGPLTRYGQTVTSSKISLNVNQLTIAQASASLNQNQKASVSRVGFGSLIEGIQTANGGSGNSLYDRVFSNFNDLLLVAADVDGTSSSVSDDELQAKIRSLNGVVPVGAVRAQLVSALEGSIRATLTSVDETNKTISDVSSGLRSTLTTISEGSQSATAVRLAKLSSPYRESVGFARAIKAAAAESYAADTDNIYAYTDRLNYENSIWASFLGGGSFIGSSNSSNSSIYGVSAGYDRSLFGNTYLGLFVTYAKATTGGAGSSSVRPMGDTYNIESSNIEAGLYGRTYFGNSEIDYRASYITSKSNLKILANLVDLSQSGDIDTSTINGSLKYGYVLDFDNGLFVKPQLGASFFTQSIGRFTGAGPSPVSMDAKSASGASGSFDVDIRKYASEGTFFFFTPGIERDIFVKTDDSKIKFVGSSTATTYATDNVARTYFKAVAGSEVSYSDTLAFVLSISTKLAQDQKFINGSIGAKFKF